MMNTSENGFPAEGESDVTIGTLAALTVSLPALESVEPAASVKTARYSFPFSAVVVPATVSDPVVFPASVVSFVNVEPPFVETCHWIVAAEHPVGTDAAAVNVAVPPAVTVRLPGCVVTVGAAEHAGALTVSVAALVVVEPDAFVNTASYSLPDCDVVVPLMVSVADVAPETFVKVEPPLVETSHCTVGAEQLAGVEAAAVNVAVAPAVTVALAGCVVIAGAAEQGAIDVSVAALESVEPAAFVNTARYSLPLLAELAVTVSESVVFPLSVVSLLNVEPPFVDTCHCTAGAEQLAGVDAVAVNTADEPSAADWFVG